MTTKRQLRSAKKLKNIERQKEKYPSITGKIIHDSDIILEILDSRFVNDTRNIEAEKEIIKRNKKIIFVLNKSDIAFPKKKEKLKPYAIISCKERKGIKNLRDKIKEISKKIKKEKVVVGVIGYPNTGKSSLINSLIGKGSAPVSSQAGFTKGMQKLKLSEGIVLIDTPGIIPEKEYSTTKKELILKYAKVGGKSYSQIKEPELVIAKIMEEHRGVLEKYYNIRAKNNVEILLEELGRKKGLLKKGGEVDEDKTARLILKDWQTGQIKI
jgi:ribosome biogenesis GTPase A